MWSEGFTIKVVPECSVKRESITVDAYYVHDLSQPPLDIRTPSEQMDRTLEESWRYQSATIPRRNAVPKDKFRWNVAIELIFQAWVFGHNDNAVAMESELGGLVQNPG